MRAAAPFLPAGYREAAYLLGTAKQTGRISPMDLALTAAPTFFSKTQMGQGIAQRVGDFTLPGMERNLREIAVGSPKEINFREFEGPTRKLISDPSPDVRGYVMGDGLGGQNIVEKATQGIFGKGGDFNVLKGSMLADPSGKIKLGTAAALGTGVISLVASAKTPQEAGENLVAQTGNSDDYERGANLFAQLKPELFEVPEQFRMNVKKGGFMRTGFREGTGRRGLGSLESMGPDMAADPRAGLSALGDMKDREFKFDAQEFMINKYKEDGTKPNIIGDGFVADGEGGMQKMFVIETPGFGTMTITLDQYLENFGIPERNVGDLIIMTEEGPKVMNKDNKAAGGLMRTNFDMGGDVSDRAQKYLDYVKEMKEMGVEPMSVEEFNRFLDSMKDNMAAGGLMRTNFAMGSDDDPKPLPEDPTKPVNPFGPKPIKPLGDMKMADISYSRKEKAQMLADQLAEEEYGMDFYDLDIRTQMKVYQIALDMIDEGGNAMGGLPNDRTNFALGTRPTAQESGLGGLPIEADMRYTGGFMPYGAKEKADDVPARLSKNEFVFTADAVRAAGGGSVQKGAQRMYNTMKQLEAKPEAKGMMA